MVRRQNDFWLINGFILSGMLAGLGLGIMVGPHLRDLLANYPVSMMSGMIGMGLITFSSILIGILRSKVKPSTRGISPSSSN